MNYEFPLVFFTVLTQLGIGLALVGAWKTCFGGSLITRRFWLTALAATLAGLVESNSRYVSQVINDTYGKNFRAYLNEYRIREARLRLMDTAAYGHYTIKAIAESVGYKSHTNFINIFKDITGITPSIYQRIAKEQAAGGGEAR